MTYAKTYSIATRSIFALVIVLIASHPVFVHAATMTTTNQASQNSTSCSGVFNKTISSLDTSQLPADYATPGNYCVQIQDVNKTNCNTGNSTDTFTYQLYNTSPTVLNNGVNGGVCTDSTSNTTNTSYRTITYLVPTASLQGGATIHQGDTAQLTWSSNVGGAGTCAGTNFSTGGASSGSVSVSPAQTTTYSMTCVLSGGTSASASQTVTVIPPLSNSTTSCSPNKTTANVGDTVTWTGQTTGGTSPFNYLWLGDNLGSNSGFVASTQYSTTTVYSSAGVKSASVQITDSSGSPGYSGLATTGALWGEHCTGTPVGPPITDINDGGGATAAYDSAWAQAQGLLLSAGPGYCADGTVGGYPGEPNWYKIRATLYTVTSGTGVSGSIPSAVQTPTSAVAITYSNQSNPGTPPATGTAACSSTVTVSGPPSAPVLTCPATGTTNQNLTFTFSGSDPNGEQIRYGYNWTNDNNSDFWVPTSGYINSGTSENVMQSWSTPGTYIVQALDQNTDGLSSSWSSCSVTITSASLPNLTAGTVSPTSATAGTAATFSATVSNTGAGSTGTGFTDLFQTATNASGAGSADVGTYSMGTLAANATAPATLSYTFPSADGGTTQYMRVCADKSSAGDPGVITESPPASAEQDNCGAWTAIAVGTGTNPPTCSLSASPTSITSGNPSMLTWSSGPTPSSCKFSDESSSRGASGTRSVSPTVTSSYSVSCTTATGSCTPPPVTVTVGPAPCTAVPVTLTATPMRVKQGNTATLTWTVPQVDASVSQCTITGPGFNYVIPVNSCNVSGGGGSTPSNAITTQTTFTLTCGSATSATTIDVVPAIAPF